MYSWHDGTSHLAKLFPLIESVGLGAPEVVLSELLQVTASDRQ